MNVLTFTGNLGRDCRTNGSGSSFVANFAGAMTSGYGDKKQTIWVDCSYWGKGAEAVAPYLVKGQSVCVTGELGMKEATDKYPAGPTCRVTSLTLTGGKRDSQDSAPRSAPKQAAPAQGFDDSEDIPF